MRRLSGTFTIAIWVAGAILAQIPGGPGYPGGYPPGRYPGGGRAGAPFPPIGKSKKSKTTKGKAEPETLISLNGMLRRIDDQFVVIEPKDTRVLNLKRTEKTKFFKDGNELKPAELTPGDQVLAECVQDEEGFYYAVNVILQKAGTTADRASAAKEVAVSTQKPEADNERPVLRRADTPPAEETQPNAAAEERSERKDPDILTPQPDDPDRPVLRRGKPVVSPRRPGNQPSKTEPEPPPTRVASAARIPSTPPRAAAAPAESEAVPEAPPVRKSDPLLAKARAASESFTESLPNYTCREMIARFVSTTHTVQWKPMDVITADLVYEDHREDYRNLTLNGKPVKKNITELSGAWSTGEFGTTLVDLFSPATAADFSRRKEDRIAGRAAVVYDFLVDHEHSHWTIQVASQLVRPAYRGSVWIDRETARVLRIEMQAMSIPAEFPWDKTESAVDYEFVRLGTEAQFLLAVHAEVLGCQRGTNVCSRNVIDFRNYHKYTGESSIQFK